eukprot:754251-Hanusia_phi.AAC.1
MKAALTHTSEGAHTAEGAATSEPTNLALLRATRYNTTQHAAYVKDKYPGFIHSGLGSKDPR